MIVTNECLSDVPYSDLTHSIYPYVTTDDEGDLPDAAVINAIRESAIGFIQRSQCLRTRISMDAQCGVDEYPLEVSCEYYILSIRRVTVCNEGYEAAHEEDVDNLISRNSYKPESKHLFWRSDDNWLVVRPAPDADMEKAIICYASIAPSLSACTMPREVSNRYGEAIVNGALAKLLLLRGQPWYDPQQSVLRSQQYERAIAEARASAIKGGVTGKHKGSQRHRHYRRGI